MNFQLFKLVLEKAEEPEIKLPTSVGSSKKQESSRKNIYFCFIGSAKAFDSVDHSVDNVENLAGVTGLEKVSFYSNPKERQWQRMLKLVHNCTYLTH